MKRVFVALDRPDLSGAIALAKALSSEAAGFKVGLELLMAHGPAAISEIVEIGLPVFADAKLHDIPNTVLAASKQIRSAGATWLTVHATAGGAAVHAAAEGMESAEAGGVLAVTVLTSMSEQDLEMLRVGPDPADWAVHLAEFASRAGARGVVCSPLEVEGVRARLDDLTLFTPGVRRPQDGMDDQVRVSTPAEAVGHGADFVVIGRPVTGSVDPEATLREINETLSHGP